MHFRRTFDPDDHSLTGVEMLALRPSPSRLPHFPVNPMPPNAAISATTRPPIASDAVRVPFRFTHPVPRLTS